MSQKIRFILDMGPLLVFFLIYRFYGLIPATGALIGMTLVSLAITYAVEKKISPMPLASGIAVAFFGGLTIWLDDELFIKMKPTLINLLFAAILLGGLLFNKAMLKYVLQTAIQLSEEGWKKLSFRWGIFFIFLALLNEIVWRNSTTDFWVNFKVFGMFTLTMAFMMAQLPLIKKYIIETNDD